MRGISYRFGEDVVREFVEKHKLGEKFGVFMLWKHIILLNLLKISALIARAHQVVPEGFEFFADHRLLTLFSAPNYGGQFNNYGAALRVSEELKWTIMVSCLKVKCI